MKKLFIKAIPMFLVLCLCTMFITPALLFGQEDSEMFPDLDHASKGFVELYYKSILMREPSDAEAMVWVDRLNSGEAAAFNLLKDAIFGMERGQWTAAMSNNDFVAYLYWALFMRTPDKAGSDAWIMRIDSGWSREMVLQGFAQSDEFLKICKVFNVKPILEKESTMPTSAPAAAVAMAESENDDSATAPEGNDTSADDQAFNASLSGANEVPAVNTTATGTATFMLNDDNMTLSYTLNVTGLTDPQAAHIHWAKAGSNGPVVVLLFPKGTYVAIAGQTVNGMLAQGTISAADLKDALAGKTINDLIAGFKSGDAYVNVHTLMNPNGEIRGQIQ